MPMVKVWVMHMLVLQRLVPMPMRVRLGYSAVVRMLMVGIVHVAVLVFHRLMNVFVVMALGKMQIQAETHESRRKYELLRDWLVQHGDRHDGPDKRRQRKVRAGACASEVTQRQNEQNEADADAEKPDGGRNADHRCRRQARAERERQAEIDAAGGQSLDQRDQDRIGGRKFAGQVVVYAPGKACAGHSQGRP